MKITWITPDLLAASGIPLDADEVRDLHAQGIRAILSLTEHPLTRLKTISRDVLNDLDMTYFHVPIPDQEPPTLPQARDILRHIAAMYQQRRPLLVHCHAGIGRTGTALHLYYLAQGLSLDEARAQVRARKPACTLLSDTQRTFLQRFRLSD